MNRSKYRPNQQPDPEEVGEMFTRLNQLRGMLSDTISDLVHMRTAGGTPEDYLEAKNLITLRIEQITEEMTHIRAWLVQEGVMRGGGS